MIHYVMGFMFDHSTIKGAAYRDVVLIQKKRPDCQAGFWNGVGGHVEAGELLWHAMVREFHEETGVKTRSWEPVFTLTCPRKYKLHVYRSFELDAYRQKLQTLTDEWVNIWSVYQAMGGLNVIPNLRWMIPLILDQSIRAGYTLIDTKLRGDGQ